MAEQGSFDNTIGDPTHPEHVIEDAMHGPSAVFDMLCTRPMPDGDGSYRHFGTTYTTHGAIFDHLGRPADVIGRHESGQRQTRQAFEIDDWVTTAHQGEAALDALEAKRQLERLASRGFTMAFKPTDACGGGIRLDACPTAQTMIAAAREYTPRHEQRENEGRYWNVLAWLGKTCTSCNLTCEVAVETDGGVATGGVRIANSKPLDMPVISLDLGVYDSAPRAVIKLNDL